MRARLASALLLASFLMGCASDGNQQRQLELLASNRASLLAAELPLEAGPLSIMRASSKGTTIEIMMVYNQEQQGAKPLQQVLNTSITRYCTNKDTKANLDAGLSYRIKMRNSRGQLMADEFVSQETCTTK
ncbi:GspS/AspS pilotin family protein [Vibrio scophthalmi]|uniref:Type II secretion system pilot lipoprotein GspS-beta n=2 Tax=Vibrio scophthalmi TaxID=45658 RepID=A0A1B1NPV7_9VIBR|nr:GspS/AspS pilotin family protein [Vibrio scophthalmi]ANS85787.1 hypothetical protein VSVS12_02025 [Vibrio scophthalmi]ANU36075.1 hypothetical protein VSVS05_00944 [Vibrio scophthalmi]EGU30139.1 hypothetical protein VIS19158_15549 [Vibrio scophthalmi LMG 19158]ODS11064.1 hypothetical protein VSF3289_01325 [Vibrio scophthalmi]